FLPASCPIAQAMGLRIRQKLSSLGPIFASTPQVRQPPKATLNKSLSRSCVMANFLLVHGAWLGSWCWRDVLAPLRSQGHRVHAVTLTGVGERSHLRSPDIMLETHIADVVHAIEMEEMQDLVLAVHSYAGMLGTAVADRMPQRLRHLV